MKGFKRCSNGHFYKEDILTCPHCAGNAGNSDLEKTSTNPSQGSLDKTQIFGLGAGDRDTQLSNSGDETQVFGKGSNGIQPQRDLDKTFIGGVSDSTEIGNQSPPRAARMMTGWLVSFTIDPMGVDYRIFEGNNSIGRDSSNSISITTDHTISGKHANILHKKGQFWIKDEMAANGTFVNGDEIEIEKAFALKDGDEIKLGDTVFIFKTWH